MLIRKIWQRVIVLGAVMFATFLGNAQSTLSRNLGNDEQPNVNSRLERLRKTLKSNQNTEFNPDTIQSDPDKPDDRTTQWGDWTDWYNGFRDWSNY